ncbi:Polyadenylate-binding protein 2 [Camellia lanceoleosa]|uniref:Polyadenylate-binding protein 2 n=1 Tax=Camellia lanceoleosa TaxID=1840588 RepID=A0ACC0IW18_9ERIC|nr:Polyadenylate-binding protein 2 [Camellia lanceoleosa]
MEHQEQEQEHEVYGADIPDEGEMDADVDMSRAEDDDLNSKDLEDMKKRLKEIEEEAGALREMQSKVEKEMGAVQDSSSPATQAEKEEVDSRSIYVGNVDYVCTPEEVQQHFQSCGTVNRVTILTDKFGQPKGFAYVEFVEIEAVQNALLLNESELHGRQLKVSSKRTNIPGMKQHRGRRPNPYIGFRTRRPFMPVPPFYPSFGYGEANRSRGLASPIKGVKQFFQQQWTETSSSMDASSQVSTSWRDEPFQTRT